MPLEENTRRTPGKFNLFDVFVVAVLLAAVVLLYQRLTVDYRVAPPYALEENQVRATIDLQLPRDMAWLCDEAVAGQADVDPRTGAARARVTDCSVLDGLATVALDVNAVRDGAGRLLYRGEPLIPGRTLRIETEKVVLEGVVRRVSEAVAP